MFSMVFIHKKLLLNKINLSCVAKPYERVSQKNPIGYEFMTYDIK